MPQEAGCVEDEGISERAGRETVFLSLVPAGSALASGLERQRANVLEHGRCGRHGKCHCCYIMPSRCACARRASGLQSWCMLQAPDVDVGEELSMRRGVGRLDASGQQVLSAACHATHGHAGLQSNRSLTRPSDSQRHMRLQRALKAGGSGLLRFSENRGVAKPTSP